MFKEGDRIQLDHMDDPYDPIPAGTTGTVLNCMEVQGSLQVTVQWDINRSLSLVMPPDRAHKIS